MSYASPPPPHKPAPSPYSQPYPYAQQPHAQQSHAQQPHSAQSPQHTSPFQQPPAKRQRLSPDPRSPQAAYQTNGYHASPSQLPGASSYGNPYAQQPMPAQSPYSPQTYHGSPQQSQFNTPQAHPYHNQQPAWQSQPPTPASAVQRASAASPQQSTAMMPPPPRPQKEEKEEKMSVSDITDVMYGAGINLKDEESYSTNIWSQQNSFNSSTMSGGNSFNMLTQGRGDGQNGDTVGTLGGTASQEDVDKEVIEKRMAAARAKAERDQHHLNNPFLLGNVVRQKMDVIARDSGVRLDVNGLYVRHAGPEAQRQDAATSVLVNGTKTEGIVRAAGSKIDHQVPFADILSLISLAAGERLRNLIDEAYGLARARRYGDHGRIVPPDFADLAIGPSDPKPESVTPENLTGTSWDRIDPEPKPTPTIAFQSRVNSTLRALAARDQAAETARVAKREARRKAAEAAVEDVSLDTLPDAAAAPAVPEVPKISKKEAARQQKEAKNSSEAHMSATTNQTAAMMALGKKGNRYSWMTGSGAASMPTNRFVKPPPSGNSGAGSGAVTPVKKEGTPKGLVGKDGGVVGGGEEAKKEEGVKWGEWSERGEGGRGIQARDWVGVLERDGRDGKVLEAARLRMK